MEWNQHQLFRIKTILTHYLDLTWLSWHLCAENLSDKLGWVAILPALLERMRSFWNLRNCFFSKCLPSASRYMVQCTWCMQLKKTTWYENNVHVECTCMCTCTLPITIFFLYKPKAFCNYTRPTKYYPYTAKSSLFSMHMHWMVLGGLCHKKKRKCYDSNSLTPASGVCMLYPDDKQARALWVGRLEGMETVMAVFWDWQVKGQVSFSSNLKPSNGRNNKNHLTFLYSGSQNCLQEI